MKTDPEKTFLSLEIWEKLHGKGYYIPITDIKTVLNEVKMESWITKEEAKLLGYCQDCKTETCDEFCLLIEEVRNSKRAKRYICVKCGSVNYPNPGRCAFCG